MNNKSKQLAFFAAGYAVGYAGGLYLVHAIRKMKSK
jgi:hypothetical protein